MSTDDTTGGEKPSQTSAPRAAPPAFRAQQLNALSERGWAVVSSQTGAIALEDGRLVFRLTFDEAMAAARRLSTAATH